MRRTSPASQFAFITLFATSTPAPAKHAGTRRGGRSLIHPGVLLLVTILLVPGCANLLPDLSGNLLTPQQQIQLDQRRSTLTAANTFYLSARLALSANGDAWNGALRWEQQIDRYQIYFNAALGQGALVLSGQPDGVELQLADGSKDTAQDAESLLFQKTGLEFPINGLRYWVMGIPNPAAGSPAELSINALGLISAMQQSDWTIDYQSYQHIQTEQQTEMDLPRKISMKHDGVTLRLIIDRWELAN